MRKLGRAVLVAVGVAVLLAGGLAVAQAPVFHGNTKSYVFHRPGCRYFDCKHCTRVFSSREEAVAAGFRPCRVCKP